MDLPGYRLPPPPVAREDRARSSPRSGPARSRSSTAAAASSPRTPPSELREFATKTGIPVAMTLQGLGAFPSDHYLSLDMLGMHGTVYANYAINDADLLLAFGVRFDDRVTGKLSEFAKHGRIVHVDIDASEINKNKAAHIAINTDVRSFLAGDQPRWSSRATGASGTSSSTPGAPADPMTYDQRDDVILPQYVIDQFSKLTQGRVRDDHGRRPAPDVGRAVDQVHPAADLDHLGRPRLDGLRPPRRDGRAGRAARRPGRRHRRRRQLPDEHPGAGDRLLREPAGQGDRPEQPAPRHGRAVGGPVPRRQPRPHLPRPDRPPRGDRPGRGRAARGHLPRLRRDRQAASASRPARSARRPRSSTPSRR